MIFDVTDCADKCLGWAWRFAVTGNDKLVTQLSMYTSCLLYGLLMAVATIWIYSHPIASCFSYLLLLVLRTISRCASWFMILVTALAVSRWTNRCVHSSCVPMSDVLGEVPIDRLNSDPLLPGWGICVAMIWWCGIGEEDDNEKKWEVLMNIYLGSCQNGINSSLHVCYTEDESCYGWMQVAGVSHHPAICNTLGRCCSFVYQDELRCKTAGISGCSDRNMTFFEGKDVFWCSSKNIPGILHETDSKHHVMLYG